MGEEKNLKDCGTGELPKGTRLCLPFEKLLGDMQLLLPVPSSPRLRR